MPLTERQIRRKVDNLIYTKEPTLVCKGLVVTGEIPRVHDFEDTGLSEWAFLDKEFKKPDLILDDQSLFFRVPEGVVIVLGCGHAGLINIMDYVSQLTGEKKIYAIIGGTHLHGASPERLEKTIEALKQYDVKRIMLSHCTGLKTYAKLSEAIPDRCSWPGTGSKIQFGGQ
jgi:7,8-dihydropterin-6-yl-methyl-4-(beta-D-ribofuranosyl)aminobenzene 5'-phosphate synthase